MNDTESTFFERYEAQGYDVIHTGVPDFILLKDGEIEFVEVKTATDLLRESQTRAISLLEKHGFEVRIERVSAVQKSSLIEDKAKLRYLIAQPGRLAIVDLVRKKGRKYLAEIGNELGINRKVVSYHVRRLEKAGLVTTKLERTPPEVIRPVYVRYVYLTELAKDVLNMIVELA